jgi:predicted RNA polymerase sigma factor
MTAADKPSPIPDTYRRVTPSLVVQGVTGPASALREVEALAADLSDYRLFHAPAPSFSATSATPTRPRQLTHAPSP